MKTKLILAGLILSIFPLTVFSQGYVGGSVGISDLNEEGFDKGTSYSLFGGYRFGDYFALEAGYMNLGKSNYDDLDFPIFLEADGWDISALGIIPITEKFELFAKVGFMAWEIGGGSGSISVDVLDGEDFNFGAGLAYNFTDRFSVAAGYQQYRFKAFGEKDQIHNYYIGAKFYFGHRANSSQKTLEPVTYSQPHTVGVSNQSLRSVSESEKNNCKFIETITRGAGGPGDPSAHTESAMNKALGDASMAGANSYYIVNMETTSSGASVVLEALDCR